MAQARDERHRYGQHYTPPEVARVLAAFAVRSATDLVFDPSCGDGRLLAEALERKESLAAQTATQTATQTNAARPGELAQTLFGLDRSQQAVELAARTGARIARADFFDVAPGVEVSNEFSTPAQFDAIIGNPPYIRQELMGTGDKDRIQRRLWSSRMLAPDVWWPRWSGRSDIYVFFFAHAIGFLRPGGRLVFLTASSWLDAGYGAALREFLVRNFRIIAVVESAVEAFFSDASINTSITVLEREPDSRAREDHSVRFVQLGRPLSKLIGPRRTAAELAQEIETALAPEPTGGYRMRLIEQVSLARGGEANGQQSGWGKYLRAADVFFRVVDRGTPSMVRLTDMARVRFGVKTGANEFFYLTGADGEKKREKLEEEEGGLLALSDVAFVRRGLTTGANEFFYLKVLPRSPAPLLPCSPAPPPPRVLVEDGSGGQHQIESRYLSPVVFSLKEIPGIWLDGRQTARMIFNCPAAREELQGSEALKYIHAGEAARYHLRPSCASRDPWYSVARGMRPAPLIFPSKVGERWLVAVNRASVFEDKKLYGVFPREGVSALLVAAMLNSTWARYYTEVTCRQMTGAQAIADIDVAVAEQIMLPDPGGLSRDLISKLETAVTELARRPIVSIFEEVARADRRMLDELVLTAIGFTSMTERDEVLDELYQAATALVRQRLAKSRTGRPAKS